MAPRAKKPTPRGRNGGRKPRGAEAMTARLPPVDCTEEQKAEVLAACASIGWTYPDAVRALVRLIPMAQDAARRFADELLADEIAEPSLEDMRAAELDAASKPPMSEIEIARLRKIASDRLGVKFASAPPPVND